MRMLALAMVLFVCTGAAAALEPAEAGHVWLLPGKEWDAAIVSATSNSRKGALYLYKGDSAPQGGPSEGIYRRVSLDGVALPERMGWSPDGTTLAFFAEAGGKEKFCCMSVRYGELFAAHEMSSAFIDAHAWSPNSRYLAFAEQTPTGDRLRCMPKDRDMGAVGEEHWTATQVFDLPAPTGRTIGGLRWSPDSSKLLVASSRSAGKRADGWVRPSSPAVHITAPGASQPKQVWSGASLDGHLVQAEWAPKGAAIVFSLIRANPAYDIPQSLHVVRPDGTGLRSLWKGEFTRFEMSPDGKVALLWLLDKGWGDCPEPTHMAAVNIATGKTKLFAKDLVALEPGSMLSNQFGEWVQDMRWSRDGRSVSLLVRTGGSDQKYRRVTLSLP